MLIKMYTEDTQFRLTLRRKEINIQCHKYKRRKELYRSTEGVFVYFTDPTIALNKVKKHLIVNILEDIHNADNNFSRIKMCK